MGSLQEQPLPLPFPLPHTDQQHDTPRSHAAFLESTGKETVEIMGRSYRTPSPTRGRGAFLHPITPKGDASFASTALPSAPQKGPHHNIPHAAEILGPYIDAPVVQHLLRDRLSKDVPVDAEMMADLRAVLDHNPAAAADAAIFTRMLAEGNTRNDGEPPKTPRRSSRDNLSTPVAKSRYADKFGLLTPSTPGFGRTVLETTTYDKAGGEVEGDDGAVGTTLVQARTEIGARKSWYSKCWRTEIHPVGDDDSDDDEPLQTHYEKLQQQIRDAELAAQVAGTEGTSRTRRSTRIATKDIKGKRYSEIPTVPVPTKSTKASKDKEIRDGSPATPPESSLGADAVVSLPPDLNPALLTLDWQLQYPPGGSTHPSYAYPQMDPRLFFNPATIPIVDGLPTVLALPVLVLPMGWRQVSWAGFLPIVFDPCHQGFKLTPIGPLPLTCEEVQQGGLAKFVPGGECHPEAGLLPDASTYSDGSNGVLYNFEAVDWVLPWPRGEIFQGPSKTEAASSTVSADATAAVAPRPFYFEPCDCPDGIVDLEDAWHWLKEKELNPGIAFVPSPTKTWRGSGIHKISRKFKAPMASLMAATIADKIANPDDHYASYLMNQNGRQFCHFKSVASPVDVNVALLKDVEITIVELLCYFPNIYFWRKAGDRFVRAGFGASEIANFINWSRALEGEAGKLSGSINDQIWYETDYETAGVRRKVKILREQTDDEVVSYTTESWSYLDWVTTDYPLLALAHGLQHVPEGPDAGPLTAVINWCRAHGRYDALLSDVPALVEEAGLQSLIEAGENEDPDKEVLGRYVATLRKDRRRVLAAKKRAAEEEDEEDEKNSRGKRMRTE